MERLRLIKLQTIESTNLISVSVFLGSPESTVPVLTASGVTRCKFVTLQLLYLKNSWVVELNTVIAGSPIVSGKSCGAEVACSECCCVVIKRLMVTCGSDLCLCSEPSGGGMELIVSLWDQTGVETGGCEVVWSCVKGLRVENFTGLFSDGFSEMVVVDGNAWLIASVARDHSRFFSCWELCTHIIGGGTVEVVSWPLEELIFSEDLSNLGIGHVELCFWLEERGWGLWHFCNSSKLLTFN